MDSSSYQIQSTGTLLGGMYDGLGAGTEFPLVRISFVLPILAQISTVDPGPWVWVWGMKCWTRSSDYVPADAAGVL
jgi:hypothetical protein